MSIEALGARMRTTAMSMVARTAEDLTNVDLQHDIELSGLGYRFKAVLALAWLEGMVKPQWQLALAIDVQGETVGTGEWTAEQRRIARVLYRKLLGGAGKAGGDNEGFYELPLCLHFVRETSERDRERFGELLH